MKSIQEIAKMKVSIGFGENHFTMSRGSFHYKKKLDWRRELRLVGKEKKEDGYLLKYTDSRTSQIYFFRATQKDSQIYVEYAGGEHENVNRYWITLPTNENEHIYGCGETYSKLDLKGECVRIWVAEHQNTSRISKKIIREKFMGKHPARRLSFEKYESYYAQPTFTSSDMYFMHVFTNEYSEFDFTKPNEITLYLQEKPSFVIDQASDFTELSEKMANLLGHQKKLPDWIYDGTILAVQEGCDVIDAKLQKAKKAKVPVCGIWSQDWSGCRRNKFGYQVMWNWKWDEQLYPGLKDKISEWRKEGIRFLGYINPFLAIEKELYKEASAKGYCVKNADGSDYLVTITVFPAAMIDFTNPDAYEWYKNLIKENMIGLGMGGWMADFGEYLPVDAVLFSGEDPKVLHNQWPAIWARMNQEAIAECGAEEEVFFFTRAGHTGTVSTSTMMWTGDQHVDWSVDDGIPSVIPATLSLAMSGYGITHSDTGGYTTIMHMRRTKELLMRWEEMNIFSPLLRTHEGNQPINDVQFDDDEELLKHLAKCAALHKKLKPYLKACVDETVEKGTPVMRPLFYHYDESLAYEEMTEYLLGRDILVAPVLEEGSTQRSCYLPEDRWIQLFTGMEFEPGVVQVHSPIGRPAVFIRKDSPYCEEILQATANNE